MFRFEEKKKNEELIGKSIPEYIAWYWKHDKILCLVVAAMIILFIICFVCNDVCIY